MSENAVWDAYLSERDREHNKTARWVQNGLGDRPALVLVDIYDRVYGDRREPLLDAIKRFPSSCGPAAWDALPALQRILKEFRRAGLPVVHVTGAVDIPNWRRPADEQPDREALEAAYRIRPEVAPEGNEPVIRKSAPSAFFGTILEALLRQRQVDGVVVVGESTSGCIHATAVDAASHRFKVTVVEDCVFDRTEASHGMALYNLARKYADVRSIDEVVADLQPIAGR